MDSSDAPFINMSEHVPPKPKRQRGGEEGNRTAVFHGNHLSQYGDNLITTSKSTWWSYLPRSLFEQ